VKTYKRTIIQTETTYRQAEKQNTYRQTDILSIKYSFIEKPQDVTTASSVQRHKQADRHSERQTGRQTGGWSITH